MEQRINQTITLDSWEVFNERFMKVCKEENIDKLKKYKEESWSKFIKRLED